MSSRRRYGGAREFELTIEDAYSAQEYLDLMDKFKKESIPLSVGVLDIDWWVP